MAAAAAVARPSGQGKSKAIDQLSRGCLQPHGMGPAAHADCNRKLQMLAIVLVVSIRCSRCGRGYTQREQELKNNIILYTIHIFSI